MTFEQRHEAGVWISAERGFQTKGQGPWDGSMPRMTEDPQEGQEGDSSERGHGYGFIRLENEIVFFCL